jgi:hypothetical protein
MALRDIFSKLIGRRGNTDTAPETEPMEYQPLPAKGVSPVMLAIRSSSLDAATTLMQGGAEVDFSDPAIETQMRVATYETNFEFLNALDARRKIQDAAEKETACAADVTGAQLAEGEKLQKLAGITTAVSGGTESNVAAPKTASFSKKPGRTV